MRTKNIIPNEGGKPFAISQHIILKNFWEYYLEAADENGIAFGYVMGDFNEWGSVDLNEIKPYMISRVVGAELDTIMPPEGYHWEDELQDAEPSTLNAASETHSPLTTGGEYSFTG